MIKAVLPDSKLTFQGFVGDGFDGGSYWYVDDEKASKRGLPVKLSRRDRAKLSKLVEKWAMQEFRLQNHNPYFRKFPMMLHLGETHARIQPSYY